MNNTFNIGKEFCSVLAIEFCKMTSICFSVSSLSISSTKVFLESYTVISGHCYCIRMKSTNRHHEIFYPVSIELSLWHQTNTNIYVGLNWRYKLLMKVYAYGYMCILTHV